jgi:raffinose/stachyose/melibiose transport system substrate-binding protein
MSGISSWQRRVRGVARLKAGALGISLALLAAACGSGSPSSTNAPKGVTKTVTIVAEDGNYGTPGRVQVWNEAATAFDKLHPGVHVVMKSQSFAQLEKAGILELSSSNAPSVFEANEGYLSLGQFVKDHLLVPLDSYAAEYHWLSRQSPTLIDLDGRQTATAIGTGQLWGLSATGDWVGVFYNKKLLTKIGQSVPTTFNQFVHDMALAKAAGTIPLATSGGAGSDQLFHAWYLTLLAQDPSMAQVRDLVLGIGKQSWANPAVERAAATLVQWADAGYFSPGYAGITNEAAIAQFTAGKALFLITGNWNTSVVAPMGATVGMFPLPSDTPAHGPEGIATGGLTWTIPVHGPHHALAAQFINFLTGPQVAQMFLKTDQIPATTVPGESTMVSGMTKDALVGWRTLSAGSAPMPYPDWSTPDFYNQLVALTVELTAHRISPQQFGAQLEQDYVQFRQTLG